MLIPLPVLEAYRRDIGETHQGARPRTLGPDDAEWLRLALGLERQTLVLSATAVLELAVEMEEAGAYHLAFATLSSFRAQRPSEDGLERGRALALQARISWKAGDIVGAEARYHTLAREGRDIPELRVRAYLGQAVVAQLRGNYPALRRHAARAARVARTNGLHSLEGLAHHFLMVAAVAAGDLSAGLVHGWRAYQSAAGERVEEAERLLNLAQLLLETHRPLEAAAGFRAALQLRPRLRIALPSLGGLAVSAASLGQHDTVRSVYRELTRIAPTASLPYHVATAWTELSAALVRIGDVGSSKRASALAGALAREHGFHEVSHRLEIIDAERRGSERRDAERKRADAAPSTPIPLTPGARRVAHAVACLRAEPER